MDTTNSAGTKPPGASLRCLAWALVSVTAWAASPAFAQFNRLADEIELKRLDLHPRPSLRNEIGTRLYGVIDLAVASGRAEAKSGDCDPAPSQGLRVTGIGPSLIGIRSDVLLDKGWQVHVQLEHGFNADSGTSKAVPEAAAVGSAAVNPGGCDDDRQLEGDFIAFWDRRASVGLSHRHYGRLDIGRVEQPAQQIAFMASPWGPDSVASAGDRSLYVPAGDGLKALPGRSDHALTYQTPYSPHLALQVQVGVLRRPSAPSAPAGVAARSVDQHGASLVLSFGALRAGIGWQRWDDGSHSLPLALLYQLGHWRAHTGLTVGQRAGLDFRNVFVGASYRERSGARPGEIKLGLNVFEMDGKARQWTVGAGYEYPFSRRTAWQANVGVRSSNATASRVSAEVGFRHAFAL